MIQRCAGMYALVSFVITLFFFVVVLVLNSLICNDHHIIIFDGKGCLHCENIVAEGDIAQPCGEVIEDCRGHECMAQIWILFEHQVVAISICWVLHIPI